ncbi:hypothetical protein DFH28DRAFT_961238, partial [Melampsora americana]
MSWVIYSSKPMEEEALTFKKAEEKISKSIGRKNLVNLPFSQSQNQVKLDLPDVLEQII